MNPLPPAPKGQFLVGNLREFSHDTLRFMLDIRSCGDIATVCA